MNKRTAKKKVTTVLPKAEDVKVLDQAVAAVSEQPVKAAAETALDAKTEEKKAVEKKPVEKKAAEKKPVEKKVAEKKPVEKKIVEKKPVEKKTAAKKVVEKAVSPANIVLQFGDQEGSLSTLEEKIRAKFVNEGHRAGNIKTLDVYVKPEDGMAYYVINGKITGSIDLF